LSNSGFDDNASTGAFLAVFLVAPLSLQNKAKCDSTVDVLKSHCSIFSIELLHRQYDITEGGCAVHGWMENLNHAALQPDVQSSGRESQTSEIVTIANGDSRQNTVSIRTFSTNRASFLGVTSFSMTCSSTASHSTAFVSLTSVLTRLISHRHPSCILDNRAMLRTMTSPAKKRVLAEATPQAVHTEDVPALQVKRLSEHATVPTRGSAGAAGFDLYAAYDTVVPARGRGVVKTDISLKIPLGCYARVAPRSGLAVKKFVDTGAGVVDYDYRGNVGVVLFNHADGDFVVTKGDRIAQLILERIFTPDIVEVEHLDETERGTAGFGSTGTGIVS
jgi:dUTP pyrophosphatase